ncbi:unnamed protein product, partial [Effrenium voratum]
EVIPVLSAAEQEARRQKELELMEKHEEISARMMEERERQQVRRLAELEERKQMEAERKKYEHHMLLTLKRLLQKLRLAKPENFKELSLELDVLLQENECLRALRVEAEKVRQEAKTRVSKISSFLQRVDQKKRQAEESRRQQEEGCRKLLEQLEQLVEAVETVAEVLEDKMNSIQGPAVPSDQELEEFSESVGQADKEVQEAYDTCMEFVRENSEAIEEMEVEGMSGKAQLEALAQRAEAAHAKRSSCLGGMENAKQVALLRHSEAVEALERKSLAEALLEREKAVFKRYDSDGDDRMTMADALSYARCEFFFEVSPKALERLFQNLADRWGKECARSLPFERFHDLKAELVWCQRPKLSDPDAFRQVAIGTEREVARILGSSKRAAVALVFRVDSEGPIGKESLLRGDLDASGASVELLYILRTSREGDKWSGHVAFPGGKREAEDADDRATAARETKEELGLDLEGRSFAFLGQLDDRPVTGQGRVIPGFYLAPLVWLQLDVGDAGIQMQESEVAAWRWATLANLVPQKVKFQVPLSIRARLGEWLPWLPGRVLDSVQEVAMPCIDLEAVSMGSTSSPGAVFRLWGLTLSATSDALVLGGGLKRQLDWPPLRFRRLWANLVLGAWCSTMELRFRQRRFVWRHLGALVLLALCGLTSGLGVGLGLRALGTRRASELRGAGRSMTARADGRSAMGMTARVRAARMAMVPRSLKKDWSASR